MAYFEVPRDGQIGSFHSTETVNTIAQFAFVGMDTTAENGAVRPDNANFGAILGINISLGTQSDGTTGPTMPVQPGNPLTYFMMRGGFCPVVVKTGQSVTVNQALYVSTADNGVVTTTSGGNTLVGHARTASGGAAGETVVLHIEF